ncbi:MAG: SDR family oxidoreductase [Candidatus Thorarchaeota archaeon]|jgi:NAD(P)-dependent dehydrogenase (short-subunit alcohol dehydrogenase family)
MSDLMDGKVCIVTGANSGIGKATAIGLATKRANVIMVCRSRDRGEEAKAEIIEKTGNDQVDLMLADLSLQVQVRTLAKEISERFQSVHVLVNNAGLYRTVRTVTEEGIETTFAVNYLAHFLLTNLLLEELKAGAPARIINVAGTYHRKASMDFNDLMLESNYSGSEANNRTKLAMVLFTYELARKLEGTGVTANCLHPGMVATSLVEKDPDYPRMSRAMYNLFKRFGSSPEKGAETSIYLASSPEVEGVTGKYFEKRKEKESSDESYDIGIAGKLWEVSLELTGLNE